MVSIALIRGTVTAMFAIAVLLQAVVSGCAADLIEGLIGVSTFCGVPNARRLEPNRQLAQADRPSPRSSLVLFIVLDTGSGIWLDYLFDLCL